jgi:hypothetical protein
VRCEQAGRKYRSKKIRKVYSQTYYAPVPCLLTLALVQLALISDPVQLLYHQTLDLLFDTARPVLAVLRQRSETVAVLNSRRAIVDQRDNLFGNVCLGTLEQIL